MSMRSRTAWLLIMCFLSAAACAPAAHAASFQEANRLYKDNKYDEAIEAYEGIVSSGFESGNLYYNLGNSYFKKGDLGRALLNYERAKVFIPHDSDLRSNYDFVRGLLNVPSRYSWGPWFFRWVDRLFDNIGINALMRTISAFWIFWLLFLSAVLWLAFLRRYAIPVSGIFAIVLIICSTALSRKAEYYERGGIVTDREAEAKFEPQSGATTYFKLTEGNPVLILDRTVGWVKVRRPDNRIGWMQAQSIALIK